MLKEVLIAIRLFCNENKLNLKYQEQNNWVDIEAGPANFCIEMRPHYCDRGRFIVRTFTKNVETYHIDDSDLFPRYYFKTENMLSELHEFMKARNLLLKEEKTPA